MEESVNLLMQNLLLQERKIFSNGVRRIVKKACEKTNSGLVNLNEPGLLVDFRYLFLGLRGGRFKQKNSTVLFSLLFLKVVLKYFYYHSEAYFLIKLRVRATLRFLSFISSRKASALDFFSVNHTKFHGRKGRVAST